MTEEKKTGGKRPETRFWLWSEQWLLGSTRTELTNEERAVFIDFLCLAAMKGGCIECYSRDQLASQLCISRELLDHCVKKFIETGKIERKYYKREKKEIFCIKKWEQYQPEYLWKKPYKSTKKRRSAEEDKNDAQVVPIREEKKEKEKKIKEDKKKDESLTSNNNSSNSPLLSNSKSFTEGEITIKEQFLSMLRECKDYPFNEAQDSILFSITVKEFPNINIIQQTARKIAWWKEHSDALKANPKKQLQDWFKKEHEFQKRGGPQQIGGIMQEIDDPDHMNFIKKAVGLGASKKKKRIDY